MEANFNWNGFLLSISIKVKDLAEILNIMPHNLSAYKRKNYIPISLKQKLDEIYSQEYVNKFIIL
jgi:phage antirepressor YoqD-like protein